MSDLNDLQQKVIKFRDARDWKQFHNPKDIAISLNLEAAELLEHFQWKNNNEVTDYLKTAKGREIEKEIADVMIYILYLSHYLKIDLAKAVKEKLKEQAKKYPISKSKGSKKKYTEL